MKGAPPPGAVPGFVQLGRNLPQGLPLGAQEFHQLRRLSVGLVRAGIGLHGRLALGNHGGRKVLRAAQPRAPGLLGRQGVLGACGNRLALVLGNDRKKSHRQGIGIGHVAAHEVDPRVAQGEDEARVAAQPVQFGDEQRRAHAPGLGDGGQQLRALVLLAALDFDVLGAELGRVGHERAHGRLLCFESQARGALFLGGDSVVWGVATDRRHRAAGKKSETSGKVVILRIANARLQDVKSRFGWVNTQVKRRSAYIIRYNARLSRLRGRQPPDCTAFF